MVATAAGIVSIPLIYELNKCRRPGSPPYRYTTVFDGMFKLFQILATKVSIFKKNFNLSISSISEDEGIVDNLRDWDEESVDVYEARVQFFSERGTDEEEESVSEPDIRDQVSWEEETEEQTTEDDEDWNERCVIPRKTRVHVPLKRETLDEENIDSVWDWGDDGTQAQDFSKAEPYKGTANVFQNGGEVSFGINEAPAQVSMEKENDKGTEENGKDGDKKSVTPDKAGAQVSLQRETGDETVKKVGDWDKESIILEKIHVQVSVEKKHDEGPVENVRDLDDKSVTTHKTHAQFSVDEEKENVEEDIENARDCDEKRVTTKKTCVQVSIEDEIGAGPAKNVRDWNEESAATPGAQVFLERGEATEFQTNDEPGSSLPISSLALTYYDESQDSNQDGKANDSSSFEDQNSPDEKSSKVWQLTDGREALSDEENIYGRQDIQCLSPRTAKSDTFCCVRGPGGVTKGNFVRFSSPLPFKDLNEMEKDLKGDTLEQVENKDCSSRTQFQGADMEELTEKETKKGKRRRKRRNNKRTALENPDSLAANEADDEMDKGELQQGTLKNNKKTKAEDKNKRKVTELQSKTPTPKKGKQPAQQLIEKNGNEACKAEVSPEKTPRKKINLKKKDKAKKETPAQNEVHPEKRKTRFFRFLTRKNTVDPKNCDDEKTQVTDSKKYCGNVSKAEEVVVACEATTEAKLTPATQTKIEEDRDVIALYDDID